MPNDIIEEGAEQEPLPKRLHAALTTIIEAVKGGAADEIAEALEDGQKLADYAQTVFDREAEL